MFVVFWFAWLFGVFWIVFDCVCRCFCLHCWLSYLVVFVLFVWLVVLFAAVFVLFVLIFRLVCLLFVFADWWLVCLLVVVYFNVVLF